MWLNFQPCTTCESWSFMFCKWRPSCNPEFLDENHHFAEEYLFLIRYRTSGFPYKLRWTLRGHLGSQGGPRRVLKCQKTSIFWHFGVFFTLLQGTSHEPGAENYGLRVKKYTTWEVYFLRFAGFWKCWATLVATGTLQCHVPLKWRKNQWGGGILGKMRAQHHTTSEDQPRARGWKLRT